MFKYKEQIDNIPNCPPSECKPMTIESFRFVFEDIDHKNNFLPVLLINPKRKLNGNSNKCSGYALSFFISIEKARNRYSYLKKKNKNIWKTLGTHIAEGLINDADGVVTERNKSGHFDLHEFNGLDLKTKFKIICAIEV